MPRLKISCPFLDRRIKLLPCQKEMIHWWYARDLPIIKIAYLFNVSKRTIHFELFPERKEQYNLLRKRRGGSKTYYSKKEKVDAVTEFRKYVKKILVNKDFS